MNGNRKKRKLLLQWLVTLLRRTHTDWPTHTMAAEEWPDLFKTTNPEYAKDSIFCDVKFFNLYMSNILDYLTVIPNLSESVSRTPVYTVIYMLTDNEYIVYNNVDNVSSSRQFTKQKVRIAFK